MASRYTNLCLPGADVGQCLGLDADSRRIWEKVPEQTAPDPGLPEPGGISFLYPSPDGDPGAGLLCRESAGIDRDEICLYRDRHFPAQHGHLSSVHPSFCADAAAVRDEADGPAKGATHRYGIVG